MLSRRINKIEESGIRKIFALAAEGGDFVNLSIGQPHFKAPAVIKEAAIKAILLDRNSYTQTAGLPDLRERIAERLCVKNGIKASSAEVIITSGVSAALFLLFASIIDEGDEIILADPYFVLYKQLIDFLGGRVVLLDTYPTFHLDAKKLPNLITSRTKAIIVNSPNNPTGAVYGRDELAAIADVARANNLLIISDEIYESFDYEKKFTSIGSIYEKTVTLNGFSKSHAVTGWRVGFAHGPAEIIEAMNRLQQYTFVCAPAPFQTALSQELNADIGDFVAAYRHNRDYLYAELKDYYELNVPEGAFYAFLRSPQGRTDFVNELIENNLLAVPGEVFSGRTDYFRLSFAVSKEVLMKGVAILKRLARNK